MLTLKDEIGKYFVYVFLVALFCHCKWRWSCKKGISEEFQNLEGLLIKSETESKFDWQPFQTKYKKNYTSTALEKQAENNFVQNSLNTAKHNKNTDKTYTRGISSHSDMSFEQIKGKRLGLNMFKNSSLKLTPREVISNKTAPDFGEVMNLLVKTVKLWNISVDYTSRFLPVKDQRNCSASWAFASTAVVEYWISRSGKNQSFSEQNLIDCDKSSSGCSGGWPTKALNYMKKHGISSDLKYTYKAIDQKCQRIPKRWPPVLKIPNACEVEVAGNEEILKQIIAQIGPVAGVMSVTEGFASYESGVFYDEKCIKASPNHAIVSCFLVKWVYWKGKITMFTGDCWLWKS